MKRPALRVSLRGLLAAALLWAVATNPGRPVQRFAGWVADTAASAAWALARFDAPPVLPLDLPTASALTHDAGPVGPSTQP